MLLVFIALPAAAAPIPPVLPPSPDDGVQKFAQMILDAINTGNWKAVAALVLIGVVWCLRKFGSRLPAPLGPLLASDRGGVAIALLTSSVGAASTALLAHQSITMTLMISALVTGALASGIFHMTGNVVKPGLRGGADPERLLQEPDGHAPGVRAAQGLQGMLRGMEEEEQPVRREVPARREASLVNPATQSKSRFKEIIGKARHTHGWKRGLKHDEDKILQVSWTQRLRLPRKGSLRDTFKMPRVEDQGEIGSCTANATTDALEFLRLKAGLSAEQLSRLFLYYCSRKFEGIPATEDSGCQIPDVMKVARKIGVCLESLWPYDPKKFSDAPPSELMTNAAKYQILYYFRCNSVQAIASSIVQGFPVVIGFDCPTNMFTNEVNKSGKIPLPDSEGFDGGHCVEVTGFDFGAEDLEIKNSWSEDWGEGGYGRIPMIYQKKGWLDDAMSVRLVEIDAAAQKKAA